MVNLLQIPGECGRTRPAIRSHEIEQPHNSHKALKAPKKKEKKKKETMKAISLLSSVIYYYNVMGHYPFEYMEAMICFFCAFRHIHHNPADVRNEIDKVRQKYKKLWKKHGEDLMIMDILSNEVFQLWKDIWGTKPATGDQYLLPPPPPPDLDPPDQPQPSMQAGPSNQRLIGRSTGDPERGSETNGEFPNGLV